MHCIKNGHILSASEHLINLAGLLATGIPLPERRLFLQIQGFLHSQLKLVLHKPTLACF
jgi:hypothetical protein